MTGNEFDPEAPRTIAEPLEVFAELRRSCPVAHSDRWDGFWILTKYDDVDRVARDSKTFITSVQNVVPKVAFTGRRPPLHLDPPEHGPYRRGLGPMFRRLNIDRLEPSVRDHAKSLISGLKSTSSFDYSDSFAYSLPIHAFAVWLNVPAEDVAEIRRLGQAYNRAVQDKDDDAVRPISLALYEIARDLVQSRRQEPRDPDVDPVTALLAIRHDGEPLPAELVVGTIRQMLVAGMIAPTVSLGSCVLHLARNPELQAQLRRDFSLIPAAIEELLRLYSPYRGFARTAVHDVEIGGRLIKAGEPIALVYTSADRDEDVFPRADEFDIDRDNNRSMAFGRGVHKCVGAPLARMELRIALEELLNSTTDFALNGDPGMARWPEYGPISLPLVVSWAEYTSDDAQG